MTDIVVIRGDGMRPGDDIEDALLASVAAAVARGTAAIDAASVASSISLSCRYRQDVAIGDLVEVSDPDQGSPYRAQVMGISLFAEGPEILGMRLRLWRPQ